MTHTMHVLTDANGRRIEVICVDGKLEGIWLGRRFQKTNAFASVLTTRDAEAARWAGYHAPFTAVDPADTALAQRLTAEAGK